jgi:hypothetical protein
LNYTFQRRKHEQERLVKQQYRTKKKAINEIERERDLAPATFQTLQTVPGLAVHENLSYQQVVDADPAVVFEAFVTNEGFAAQEVFEVDGYIVSEDEIELGEPIEEGASAHGWVTNSFMNVDVYGDFDTEDHTDGSQILTSRRRKLYVKSWSPGTSDTN